MFKTKLTYAGIVPDNELTPEQLKRRYEIYNSVENNGDFISKLYSPKVANVIMYNMRALYSQKTGKLNVTIEEAYRLLTFKEMLDIIYRATNDLPCKGREVKPCKNSI